MFVATNKWYVSLYGEDFNGDSFNSKEEAINAVMEELNTNGTYYFEDYEKINYDDTKLRKCDIICFFVGQSFEFYPDIDIERIFDNARAQAEWEFYGDEFDYLENVPEEAFNELETIMNGAFMTWQKMYNLGLNRWRIGNVERVIV